jgi:hypothetical protein
MRGSPPKNFLCNAPSTDLGGSCVHTSKPKRELNVIKNDAFNAVKKLAFPAEKATLI